MRKLFRGVAAIVGVLALSLTGVGSAQATGPAWTSTATIKSSPDDGCPPWARDTFVRTTTITPLGDGKFKVTIADKGTFTTVKGSVAPAGGTVTGTATGNLTGSGEYTVTGQLKNTPALKALDGKTFNNGAYQCKEDVTAAKPERTAANWPLQFFKPQATTTGIDPWTWTYTTPCEKRVESSSAAAVGNIVGKVCPARVVFVPPTCANAKAAVKVHNPNSHAKLAVRFNGGPTWHMKPGATQVHEFGAGSVQVKVNGINVGVPYWYTAPTGCATPTPTATATATATPTATATATATASATTSSSATSGPVCNPAYIGVCLTGEDVDCADLSASDRPVHLANPGVDPYRLDENGNGVGCESDVDMQPASNNNSSSGGLPVTGTAVASIVGGGLILAGLGAAGVLFARRRRTSFTA